MATYTWFMAIKSKQLPAVGDILLVSARKAYDLCGRNDVGGTDSAPVGLYRVRLDRIWYDYETGYRCIGTLLTPADVTTMFRVGHTEHGPKLQQWNPAAVYFDADDSLPVKASAALSTARPCHQTDGPTTKETR